ncbi:CRTAC1 family protein [Acidobacterium sp. S8]|uniref:CRTAC1 family protein n=1 Tax=Acidobacterium sp. S8 TaxID=1641854 RepID=UPI00131D1D8A|nr:CRTAC1 family protein [Acidobacterium sp. S8]
MNRRRFLQSLSRTALVLPFSDVLQLATPPWKRTPLMQQAQSGMERSYEAKQVPPPPGPHSPIEATPLGVQFIDVATQSGLNSKTIYGGEGKNKYLLETTGCGVAFYDYDNDGWLDIFLVNGWRLEGFAKGQEPTCHLFRNNRDGTFTDVTAKAGLARSGWGQGCCIGDYNNDGHDDLFVTYYGQNALFHNNGDGTFTDVSAKAGLMQSKQRWNSGCAFLDYDRDGHLDLFVANYIDLDLKTAPTPESGPCTYKGILVACGPPGLAPGKNILYHNNGNGTFTDVSEKSGIWTTTGNYALGVAVADLDNDGWPDIYVANDSTSATLYQNQKDGTFRDIGIEAGAALSPDGKPQAGMGVTIGDYNRDGNLDVAKTNFAGDTDSLYKNLGDGNFEDETYLSGLGLNTRYLGWGIGFFDMDNDGWLDLLVANGHVYPEVSTSKTEAPYAEHKYLYRNLRNGRYEDVTSKGGSGITATVPARGCAFGDYDNDGDVDVVVNCVNVLPQLLRCDSEWKRNWIKVKVIGTKSNRTGIGARVKVVAKTVPEAQQPLLQVDEVRSGGSYYSQNDLRLHFGLDQAKIVDLLEIRWPSGQVDTFKNLEVNRLYTVEEGSKMPKSEVLQGIIKA